MDSSLDESLNVQELSRLLDLQDLRELERAISARPHVFRWFANAQVCRYFVVKNSLDTNLRHAWSQPLTISNKPGHVIVVAAVLAAERWRHATSAFMFPLKWTQAPHASHIPHDLRDVADQVAERLRSSPRLIEQLQSAGASARIEASWGLSWSPADWQNLDFSTMPLSAESAWAPLAIGLASAMLETHLSGDLLATGAWDAEQNAWSVGPETLPSKLSSGYEAGKRLFVVPASVAQDARSLFRLNEQKDAQVVELVDDPQDIYAGILPGLLQAGAEPSAAEPRQQQVDWYLTRATNQDADQYYYRVLLPAIASARRAELAGTELAHWRPEYLVSIVSNSEVLIPLTALIFRPRKLQLIYTRDTPQSRGMGKRFDKIQAWLTNIKGTDSGLNGVELQSPLVVDDELDALPQFVDCLQQLPRASGQPSVLIDTTPGKRAMQLAMLQGAQRGDRLLCWWHNTHVANRRPIPFSEKMLVWQVAADSMLRRLVLTPPGHSLPMNAS